MQKILGGVRFIMLFRLPESQVRTQFAWLLDSRNTNPAPVGIESEEIPHGFLRVRVNAGWCPEHEWRSRKRAEWCEI